MILALDHLVFGNGYGLASPYFDATYHWLVDTSAGERNGRNGRLYKFNNLLGAQLRSIEWFAPPAGTRRVLAGREFRVFQVSRRGLRVDVAWAMTRLPRDIDAANAEISAFGARLGKPY
ncbi:hypothetical protein [Methylorubrum zatmanii]